MNVIHSYPKIYTIGHKMIKEIFSSQVLVEEKIDGSQFSFMKDIDDNLYFRSKNVDITLDAVPDLFQNAVNYLISIKDKIRPNLIYRGECLKTNKHNVLAYQRVPKHNFIGFDIENVLADFISDYSKKQELFSELDLETAPLLYEGIINSKEDLEQFLSASPLLGGDKIEGVVVKNYNLSLYDSGIMIGKYVADSFKETFKDNIVSKSNVYEKLINSLKTENRWRKAVQHLQEAGKLENSMRDIPRLLQEVYNDVIEEESDYIKEFLYKSFIDKINRDITRGLPEWYKNYLLENDYEV